MSQWFVDALLSGMGGGVRNENMPILYCNVVCYTM